MSYHGGGDGGYRGAPRREADEGRGGYRGGPGSQARYSRGTEGSSSDTYQGDSRSSSFRGGGGGGYRSGGGGRYDERRPRQDDRGGPRYDERGGGGGGRYEDRGERRYDDRGPGRYDDRGGPGRYDDRPGYRGGYGGPPRGRGGGRGGGGGGGGFRPTFMPGPIVMSANHFRVRVKPTGAKVIKHLVVMVSENDENSRLNYESRRDLFERACRVMKVDAMVAYDGDRIMISRQACDFATELVEKRVKVKITCQPQTDIDLSTLAEMSEEQSKEALQVLDIIMKSAARLRCEPGKSQTFLHDRPDAMVSIPRESVCLWLGHWQSCQVMQHAKYTSDTPQYQTTLVMNAAGSPAMPDMPLAVWTRQTMGESILDLRQVPSQWIAAFEGKIRGHKFETRHQPPRRSVKIASVVPDSANQSRFTFEDEEVTITEYFRRRYQIQLKYPDAPLVLLAPKKKNLLMPAELLYLSKQKLTQPPRDNVKKFIVDTMVMEPGARSNYIMNALNFVYRDNKCLEHFNVEFQPEMLSVKGEILEAPTIAYRRPGDPSQFEPMAVNAGKWNLIGKAFVLAEDVANWALINFLPPDRMRDIQQLFQRYILSGADRVNMRMAPQPRMAESLRRLDDLDELAARLRNMAAEGKKLDIIFVFIERPSTVEYNKIKSALDEIACTQVLTAEKTPVLCDKSKGIEGHVGNILSKVNMKRGGVNHYIDHAATAFPAIKLFLRDPRASCILGCDVSLRQAEAPRTAVRDSMPSITAMVCSIEPQCGQYLHSFRAQHAGTETVDELTDMLNSLLSRRCMLLQTDQWPQRVIFLRDGLSDGSMSTVANDEIQRIYQTYEQAQQPRPKVLYISVRRRHNTRFFPQDAPSRVNMPPGTCVFDTLSLSMPFPNFYLISHDGIKGTSHPARYVILHDGLRDSTPELKEMSDAQLVKAYAHLAFQLCHLYGRCQRSVSVPAPIYYVNLLTERARIHVNGIVCERFGIGLISDSGSHISGPRPSGHIKDVLDVKEVDKTIELLNRKLREVETARMFFYC